MKKRVTIVVLSLAALLQSVSAQRLGIGLEAGSTGFGA